MNFNKILEKNLTYDYSKSHKKQGFTVSKKYILRRSLETSPPSNPLCIPFRGNKLIRGNAVCSLSISSESIGIFELHLEALIQVSIEAF